MPSYAPSAGWGDSAYGNSSVVGACRRKGVEFSVVMVKNTAVQRAIDTISDDDRRCHPPPRARHHRNRLRGSDRWTTRTHALGPLRGQLRMDPLRRDRPQPASRCWHPRRRPTLACSRGDPAPKAGQRRRPPHPTSETSRAAVTDALAMVKRMASTMDQHHRTQPTRHCLNPDQPADTGPNNINRGRAGQTSGQATPKISKHIPLGPGLPVRATSVDRGSTSSGPPAQQTGSRREVATGRAV